MSVEIAGIVISGNVVPLWEHFSTSVLLEIDDCKDEGISIKQQENWKAFIYEF